MDLKRLHEILADTTIQLRKGEVVETRQAGMVAVTEVYAMPHVSEANPDLIPVDLEFLIIGVDLKQAEAYKAELISILADWPKDGSPLEDGPSYIALGGVLGDQGAAFQLIALGFALGMWRIITPGTFGFKGAEARQLAGAGMVLMTGYKSRKAA